MVSMSAEPNQDWKQGITAECQKDWANLLRRAEHAVSVCEEKYQKAVEREADSYSLSRLKFNAEHSAKYVEIMRQHVLRHVEECLRWAKKHADEAKQTERDYLKKMREDRVPKKL